MYSNSRFSSVQARRSSLSAIWTMKNQTTALMHRHLRQGQALRCLSSKMMEKTPDAQVLQRKAPRRVVVPSHPTAFTPPGEATREAAPAPALGRVLEIDPAHSQPLGSWSAQQMAESRAQNPYMMTWVPGKLREKVPVMTHGKGVYLYDTEGKQYLDWTSQAVCSNLGYTAPQSVLQGAMYQMTTVPFTYAGIGVTEVRLRLNQLLQEVFPKCQNSSDGCVLRPAVFPSSGGEANEAAILMARRYTGRHKILSFYRSYHGATAHAASATGDYRRWYHKEQSTGFVKMTNPFSLFFKHQDKHADANNYSGDMSTTLAQIDAGTSKEQIQAALDFLEEQIINEGPEQIASLVMEPIVGAGGCLIYPTGYVQGIRKLCDKYGILLHFDEVMVGFGRTGRLFGFEHYEGVTPDIFVAGKGLTGSAVPLSMVACTSPIMSYFEDYALGWGSTYQAHPVAMAVAYETVKYIVQQNILGHVQHNVAPILDRGLKQLADKYDCIQDVRSIGLFGCFDIQDAEGANPKPVPHKPALNEQAFAEYKKAYAQVGLVGLHRYPQVHSAPPLVINPDELNNGLERLDQALAVLNKALGHPC